MAHAAPVAEQPLLAEQALTLTIARRYLPEDMAHGFVANELENPDSKLVLFTIRPDRWLTFEFGDKTG